MEWKSDNATNTEVAAEVTHNKPCHVSGLQTDGLGFKWTCGKIFGYAPTIAAGQAFIEAMEQDWPPERSPEWEAGHKEWVLKEAGQRTFVSSECKEGMWSWGSGTMVGQSHCLEEAFDVAATVQRVWNEYCGSENK